MLCDSTSTSFQLAATAISLTCDLHPSEARSLMKSLELRLGLADVNDKITLKTLMANHSDVLDLVRLRFPSVKKIDSD
jgi:hypothetical protein